MASMMQLKHHAKFHAAVLRNLFDEPSSTSSFSFSPPPPSTSPASPSTTPTQEEAVPEVPISAPGGEDHFDNLTMPNGGSANEDVIIDGSCPLSRAQRKRLKVKRQKENAIIARSNKRRFIGPVWHVQTMPDCIGCSEDVQCILPSSPLNNSEEPFPAIGQFMSDGTSKPPLSRVKRRRLAKRNCQTLPRNLAAPAFMADFKGSDIIIRQML